MCGLGFYSVLTLPCHQFLCLFDLIFEFGVVLDARATFASIGGYFEALGTGFGHCEGGLEVYEGFRCAFQLILLFLFSLLLLFLLSLLLLIFFSLSVTS